jgi:cobalt-zinc-cadmium efflux system outer membrane protein
MSPRALLVLGLALVGCGGMVKERGHDDVAKIVQERTGYRTRWEKGPPTDAQISKWVNALLAGGMTRDHAVEIALVNNPALQITYEQLGVSQADMVQAGLLSNPTLSGGIGFPLKGSGNEYEGSLTESFLDIFIVPLRRKIAKQQFIAETLRVAHQALSVATDVRKAVAAFQAESRVVELRSTIAEAAHVAADLARRQHDAGNIDDFTFTQETTASEQASLDLEREKLQLVEKREALNGLLGLWGNETTWTLTEPLADLPAGDPAPDHLESRAIASRLDVSAARKQAQLFENALSLAKGSRYFGLVQVGVRADKDAEGSVNLGPTLSLELPLFDQRQGLIGRLEAQYRQAERRLAKVAIDARQEVRIAEARLAAGRLMATRYKTTLLPLRQQALSEAELLYNGMQIGLYQLLAAKQAEVEAYRAYIESLRDYWMARADLEMAVGGRVDERRPPEGSVR